MMKVFVVSKDVSGSGYEILGAAGSRKQALGLVQREVQLRAEAYDESPPFPLADWATDFEASRDSYGETEGVYFNIDETDLLT